MRGLVRSELRRLMSRRFVRLVGAFVVAGIVVGGLLQFVTSEPGLEGARKRAEVAAERCREQAERFREEFPEDARGGFESQCDPEGFLLSYDQRFRFAQEMPSIARGVGLAFIVLTFIVGASIAGAEWGSGYITSLLTWEPRRGVLLGAKVAAVGPALGVAALAGLALLTVTQYPAAVFRGTTAGVDGSFWWSLIGLGAKGGALAALWAVAGVAVATATRNTAAAIGLGLAYGSIVDPLLGAWKDWLAPWLLQRNIFHVLGLPVTATRTVEADFGGTQTMFFEVEAPSLAISLGRLSAYVAVVALIAYAVFLVRDVT